MRAWPVEHPMRVSKDWYDNYLARRSAAPPAAARGAPVDRASSEAQGPKPQPASGDESVGETEGKAENPGRRFISIESRRRRLIDPRANLWGGTKYLEDACVYAGALSGDTEKLSEGIVTQTKVGSEEEEVTIIRVWKLD